MGDSSSSMDVETTSENNVNNGGGEDDESMDEINQGVDEDVEMGNDTGGVRTTVATRRHKGRRDAVDPIPTAIGLAAQARLKLWIHPHPTLVTVGAISGGGEISS